MQEEMNNSVGQRVKVFMLSAAVTGAALELAGAGGAGLLLAGVVGSGMAYFSPELRGMVRNVLPTNGSFAPKKLNLKMLTAREYQLQEEVVVASTLSVEKIPDTPVAHRQVVMSETAMKLASNFMPDVDSLIGEGIVVFGSKGSGKTNVGALLAEQFSRFYVPMVIFDVEGDYASVVRECPNGYHAGASPERERYVSITVENAYQAGSEILENGYQVVFDLASYDTDEQAAEVMIQVLAGMTAWANSQPPEERVPCLVFLDEAAYWLPQSKVSYLLPDTQKALRDTFHVLATKGRKRGLTPILLTQRISELEKSVMAQANVYLLGKQSLDNDLDRYMEYVKKDVATREQVAAFGPGQFIVKLADGTQFMTRFNQRTSKHVSHTPKASAALRRYTKVQKRPTLHRTMPPMEDLTSNPLKEAPQPVQPVTRRISELDRAVEAWNAGNASVSKLEKALNISHHKAYQLYQQMKERRLI